MKSARKTNLKSGPLPFVFLNVATTADGKLAPASRHFIPFGSKRDQQHILELRATADAVMSGARTVDLGPVQMGTGGAKFRQLRLKRGLTEYNLRIVVSGSGTLDPKAEIFKHRFSPIIILTTGRASPDNLRQLEKLADEVKICGERELDYASRIDISIQLDQQKLGLNSSKVHRRDAETQSGKRTEKLLGTQELRNRNFS